MSPMPAQASAPLGGRSFDLTARVTRAAGDEGVLYATGTQNSGFSLFVQNDRLVFDYNAFNDHTIIESEVEVPTGSTDLTLRVRRANGRHGTASIEIDGITVGSGELSLFMRMISSVGPSVGYDHGSAVSDRYVAPFAFGGTLHEVVIQAGPERANGTAGLVETAEMARQ
jgi:arylsulfatase